MNVTPDQNTDTKPKGELALQTLAMPRDTNANGDIFGGWLVGQMDLAAGIMTKRAVKGRSATVAIKDVAFHRPVSVGSIVSCYAEIVKIGRTSLHIAVEVWASSYRSQDSWHKVGEGLFVFVAIDDAGKPRVIATES